jgi:hypothetical protein
LSAAIPVNAGDVPLPSWLSSHDDWYKYQLDPFSSWKQIMTVEKKNNNCGPAVVAMVLRYFLNENLSTELYSVPAKDETQADAVECYTEARWKYCEANGLTDGFRDAFYETNGDDRVTKVLNYRGLHAKIYNGANLVTVAAIESEINQGHLVICHVNVNEYYPPKGTRANSHWVVVFGYDANNVRIHDPGYQALHNHLVPKGQFADALWHADKQNGKSMIMIVVSKTGGGSTEVYADNMYASYGFEGHGARGWTAGINTTIAADQDASDYDTLKLIAQGQGASIVSPVLPSGITTYHLQKVRFSVKARGNERQSFGKIWIRDDTGNWNHRVDFSPTHCDYNYYEYEVDLTQAGSNLPITQFSIELTDTPTYEEWIFDWIELVITNASFNIPNADITYATYGGGGIDEDPSVETELTPSPTPNAPVIQVSPTTLHFPATQAGEWSTSKFVTVTNIGYGALSGDAYCPSPFKILSGEHYYLQHGEVAVVEAQMPLIFPCFQRRLKAEKN